MLYESQNDTDNRAVTGEFRKNFQYGNDIKNENDMISGIVITARGNPRHKGHRVYLLVQSTSLLINHDKQLKDTQAHRRLEEHS